MLDDNQKSSALDQVKRELRSILISSKTGVPLRQIKSDYEMLSCNRLPFRDFGFNDVESFMQSMPDVARERRLPDGELIYHAVGDDTTAHIQKLISSQKAPSRKKKHVAMRGRGSFRGGRSWRGGLKGAYKPTSFTSRGGGASSVKPRLPSFGRGGKRGTRGSFGMSSFNPASSGDVRNKFNPGWAGDSQRNASLNRSKGSDSDDWDKENHASPTVPHNLQIGVKRNGERTITKQPDMRDFLNSKRERHVSGESRSSEESSSTNNKFDTRANINNQKESEISARVTTKQGWNHMFHRVVSMTLAENEKMEMRQKAHANRPYRNTYMPKEVAPRFLRKQENLNQHANSYAGNSSESINLNQKSTPQLNDSYEETQGSSNWLPPERGKEYLEAFHKYFTDNNLPEPDLEVVHGKFMKRKGFYGRLMYQGKMVFPLEILETEEEARQNAAKSFCLKFDIPLPGENLPLEGKKNNVTVKSTVSVPRPPLSQPSSSTTVTESNSGSFTPFLKEITNVYKIISPSGVFIKMLPKLYQTTYKEPLSQEVIDKLKDFTDFFNVEEPVPGRFILYQVPDALNKISEEKSENGKGSKLLCTELPPVGTVFDAKFSFAYSAFEIYLQKAESADLLFKIDDTLADHCQQDPLPDEDHLVEGAFVAASYGEDEWYRARVINRNGLKVTVSFIDYGNKEEVNLSDTRLLPPDELVKNTPPLAIPCMALKTGLGDFCANISEILSSISENCPFLITEVKHLAGSHCVVDMSLPDGRSVNAMLTKRLSMSSMVSFPTASYSPTPAVSHTPQSSPAATRFMTPTTKAASQLLSQKVQSPTSQRMVPAKIFTEDPDPLVLPESESFGAYVCCVMSESSVLLRIVDDEYSGKLDELEMAMAAKFDQWAHPVKIQQSNVYACVLPSDEDEEGLDKDDSNRFHRVRVLKINDKGGTCECHLLDHGGKETIKRENIRCIDTDLNKSLSYQAIYATLWGLDNLPSHTKVAATKVLIHLTVSANVTFIAVRKDPNRKLLLCGNHDPGVVEKVRKIISCLPDVNPAKVTKIYEDLFQRKLDNVEEIIKLIPGYGYWKHALEVELIDCSEDNDDISINNTILTLLQEIAHLKAAGREEDQALKDVLGSDLSSQADTTDSGSVEDVTDRVTFNKAEDPNPQPVQTNTEEDPNSDNTNPNSPCDNAHNTTAVANQPKFFRNCPAIPQYFDFDFDQFCAIFIVRSESPSYFVAMPYDQREELTKLTKNIGESIETSPKAALVFSKICLYAVKRDGKWLRTIYVGQINHLHEVFYPDYHLYDTVMANQLFVLPPQFYSIPLLARKMALGGVRPTSQNWSEAAKYWFIQNTQGKDMYALISSVDTLDNSVASLTTDSVTGKCVHLPSMLYAQLVDTSGQEDMVIDQQLIDRGWARKDKF